MQILRHAVIVVAAFSVAAHAYAQSEPEEYLEATDAGPVLEAYEHVSDDIDEIVDDNVETAEWADEDIPNLSGDNLFDEASTPSSYWFGGAELTRLEPRYSLGSSYPNFFGLLSGIGDNGVYKDDPANAPRAYLGWEGAGGLGVRGRFWEFENDGLIDPQYEFPRAWSMDATRFDVDVYRRFRFNRGSIAAGANLATVDLNINGFFPSDTSYDAAGIGVFVEGRHSVYESPNISCNLIGRGRWAQLMGKHAYDVTYSSAYRYLLDYSSTVEHHRDDADLQIAEAAAGLELVRKFRHVDVALQYAVEVQNWSLSPNSELSFLGSTFSISLLR